MPGRKNSSLKDPELYEELREDGASKEKAARISNAAANRGRTRAWPSSLRWPFTLSQPHESCGVADP